MGLFDGIFGGKDDATTTTVSAPWKPQQPYLKDVMNDAQRLYDNKRGFTAPDFQTWVPMSGQTTEALGGMMDVARSPNMLGSDSMDAIRKLIAGGNITTKDGLTGMIGTGPNALSQFGTGIASGANGINTESMLRSLLGQGPNTEGDYRDLRAGGVSTAGDYRALRDAGVSTLDNYRAMLGMGPDTEGDFRSLLERAPDTEAAYRAMLGMGPNTEGTYRSLYDAKPTTEGTYGSLYDSGPSTKGALENLLAGSGNDAWKGMVDTEAGKIADDVNAQFSGIGRFGSGAHTNALVGALGDFRQKAAATEFDNNIARQRGLIGDITGMEERDIAKKLGITDTVTGMQERDLAKKLGITGEITGMQERDLARMLGITGELTGMQERDISRDAALTGEITGMQERDIARMLGITGEMTGIEERDLARKAGLTGEITGLEERDMARRAGLTDSITALQQGDLARNIGLVGDIGQVQGANIGNQLSAAGQLSGEQQQGFSNDRGIYGDLTNIESSELDRILSSLGMAPSIYDMQYAPYDRMAQVGSAYDDLATRQLQSRVDRYNTNQMAPWQRLGQYSSLVGGPGTGSTSTTTVSQPSNPFGGLLGGAMTGFQLSGGNPLLAALGGGLGLIGNI